MKTSEIPKNSKNSKSIRVSSPIASHFILDDFFTIQVQDIKILL